MLTGILGITTDFQFVHIEIRKACTALSGAGLLSF
jgi:hypothetical protein